MLLLYTTEACAIIRKRVSILCFVHLYISSSLTPGIQLKHDILLCYSVLWFAVSLWCCFFSSFEKCLFSCQKTQMRCWNKQKSLHQVWDCAQHVKQVPFDYDAHPQTHTVHRPSKIAAKLSDASRWTHPPPETIQTHTQKKTHAAFFCYRTKTLMEKECKELYPVFLSF